MTKAKGPTSRKAFDIEIKALDDQGKFEGYANTFGLVDSYGEEVVKGAFKRTIANWRTSGRKLPMLSQHDYKTVVGYFDPNDMEEDEKGLKVAGQILTNTQAGHDDYERAKHGLLRMSIGFDTLADEFDKKKGVRYLKEIRLWEISLVTFPANEDSVITAIKAIDFSTALTQADTEQDLWERRWELTDALGASMRSIAQDENLEDAGKIAMFGISLTQFHQAMLAWFGDALAAKILAAKSAAHQIETKAGRVLSAKNEAALKQALELIQGVVGTDDDAEDSAKSHSPATVKGDDPEEAPTTGEADAADVARLVEELKAAVEQEGISASLQDLLADMKTAS